MNKQITKFKDLLGTKSSDNRSAEINNGILLFESKNNLLIPSDLAEYFRLMDNTAYEMDKELFRFRSFDHFKNIDAELANWGGIPNYTNIINTLSQSENCFVFADFMIHTFTYAIRLYPNLVDINEIYIISGDQYKIISNSFSDFLDLYFSDSMELQFE